MGRAGTGLRFSQVLRLPTENLTWPSSEGSFFALYQATWPLRSFCSLLGVTLFYFCSAKQMEDRPMLALREQPVLMSDPPAAKARSVDRARRVMQSFADADRAVSAPLRALAGDALDARFRSWRGASGRRYVFSVYDRQSCPAFEHAVAFCRGGRTGWRAARDRLVEDTGCFPDIVLANAAAKELPCGRRIRVSHPSAGDIARRSARL